jgi:hypothetical protein
VKLYHTLADVLLAHRPGLKTKTPEKDAVALQSVLKGTNKRSLKTKPAYREALENLEVRWEAGQPFLSDEEWALDPLLL